MPQQHPYEPRRGLVELGKPDEVRGGTIAPVGYFSLVGKLIQPLVECSFGRGFWTHGASVPHPGH